MTMMEAVPRYEPHRSGNPSRLNEDAAVAHVHNRVTGSRQDEELEKNSTRFLCSPASRVRDGPRSRSNFRTSARRVSCNVTEGLMRSVNNRKHPLAFWWTT